MTAATPTITVQPIQCPTHGPVQADCIADVEDSFEHVYWCFGGEHELVGVACIKCGRFINLDGPGICCDLFVI